MTVNAIHLIMSKDRITTWEANRRKFVSVPHFPFFTPPPGFWRLRLSSNYPYVVSFPRLLSEEINDLTRPTPFETEIP